ncbi:organic cation carnitine transporter 7-like isoform A [Chlorella sorokiniana]|uniref:Organic cation carnitine transporter 7-like isoform A n=1 Tax=Chlorella sorokiniana TaxID=3076 RepID=A0A2P6TYG9_CHLSO|nr:organic cation carnitine transporter 7-like isoform A [Chlorella sorokiniana]|eukprot:PRW59112.1 organic cation carnitine transporter 7-like isoform A [Chlorella sorokiniana]
MTPEPYFTTSTAALDAIGFGRLQWLMLMYCGLAWLADACETMLLSYLGPAVRCAWGISAGAESTLTSVVFAGMLLGVNSLGAVADQLGRRRGFLLSALVLGAGGLASALAPSFAWLLVLRSVVGFALGGAPIAVTLFAELCTSETRGKWLLVMQGAWTVGTVLEAGLAWAVLPTLGWRWLLALSALPLLLLLAMYPLLPESPVWLVAKGRYAEAEAVLKRVAAVNGYAKPLRLRLGPAAAGHPAATAGERLEQQQHGTLAVGRSSSWLSMRNSVRSRSRSRSPSRGALGAGQLGVTSPGPQAPLLAPGAEHGAQPEQQAGLDAHDSSSAAGADAGVAHAALPLRLALRRRLRDAAHTLRSALAVIFGDRLRRTTLLLYCIWIVCAITYYGLVLLTTALQTVAKRDACTPSGAPNLDNSDYLAILIASTAEAPGLIAAASLIDRKGRKWTLRLGLLACTAALLGLLADPSRGGQLALLFASRAAVEGSYSVLYVYSPELYPTIVRALALAMCNGFSRLGGFLAPYATVYLVAAGRTHAAELLLGSLCGVAALCALLLPYETRGRDLQALELQPDGSWPSRGQRGSQRHSSSDGGGGGSGGEAQAQGGGGSSRSLQGVRVQPHSDDGDDPIGLGGAAQPGKKTGKPLGMAVDDEDDDMFADMVVDDLDDMEGAAAAPAAKPASGGHAGEAGAALPCGAEENEDVANKLDEATAAQAKASAPAVHRPPRHPGKPTAVQQVQARAPEPSVGAQDSCSMDAAQEQEEHESPAAEEPPAASPVPAAKPTAAAAADGAAVPLADASRSPGSSSKAPRSSGTLAAADAVAAAAAAAAAAPTLPFDSEPQLDVSQLLAKVPSPKVPAPEVQAATPAPVTPAGDAAAAAAAAGQQEQQEQLRRAAIQEDCIMAFDFVGTVSAVLKDHEQAAEASAEQAVPITDAVQEQLLVLDQLSMQAEALRRQISGLRVDLTIYRSSLAFMDDPHVACSFDGAERKVQELWAPLAAYEPPCIELPPPPPAAAEEEPMLVQEAEEEAMPDAAPEEPEPSADQLLGSALAEPDAMQEAGEGGAADELAAMQAPQPGVEAAAEGQVAPSAEQPSQLSPTAGAAGGDSEMAEGQAEDGSGGEDDSMEEEQSCSGQDQGSSEEQASSEEQGSEEQGSEEQGSEEQGSEDGSGEEPSSEAEGSQPALPPTQAVESASPGAATEPPLEQSKDGSLAPRVLSFDSEPASSEVEPEAEVAAAPMQAVAAAAAAEPGVSVSLEDCANGEVKLSLLSFYAAGQPTLQSTLG